MHRRVEQPRKALVSTPSDPEMPLPRARSSVCATLGPPPLSQTAVRFQGISPDTLAPVSADAYTSVVSTNPCINKPAASSFDTGRPVQTTRLQPARSTRSLIVVTFGGRNPLLIPSGRGVASKSAARESDVVVATARAAKAAKARTALSAFGSVRMFAGGSGASPSEAAGAITSLGPRHGARNASHHKSVH
jgi:hypothetical protein